MLSLIFVIAVAGILVKVRNHINAAVCIAACVFAEVIIIPRQDSIQHNACDCRNGEGGQCDICVGNIEGQSITPAIIRLRDFVKSTRFSTTLRTPIAEIIPYSMKLTPPIIAEGIEPITSAILGIKLRMMA